MNTLKNTLLTATAMLFVGCSHYNGNEAQLIQDIGIKYEITKSIPNLPKADAVFIPSEGKIYVKEGKEQTYLLLHEIVHQLRSEAGFVQGGADHNHMLEETIAVKAAREIAIRCQINSGVASWEVRGLVERTLSANNMEYTELSESDEKYVDKQVDVTIQLVVERLESRGFDIDKINWVKTAIMLLL